MEQIINQIKETIERLQYHDAKVLLGGSFILKNVYQLVDSYEDIDIFVYPKDKEHREDLFNILHKMSSDSEVTKYDQFHYPSAIDKNSSFKYTYKNGLIINIIMKNLIEDCGPIKEDLKWLDISIVPLCYILRAKQCYGREKDKLALVYMSLRITNPNIVIKEDESEF